MNEGMENLKETDDMVLLLERHKREIWEWQKKESQWARDKNQLDGNKQIIQELSSKLIEMGKANLALKKRVEEAEGEVTIIKGIGQNSPEMKEAKTINKLHKELNGKLQTRLTEVEDDNKKLAKQVEHLTNLIKRK